MPTLTAPSRFANVLKSFNDDFFKPNVEEAMGLPVFYHGGGRLNMPAIPMPPHWIEVDLQEMAPQTVLMVTGTNRHGVILEYLANVNVFENHDAVTESGTLSMYTIHDIVDDIEELFRPPTGILIYDYDTVGTPLVGALQPITIPSRTEVGTPEGSGLRQFNLVSILRQINESVD